METSRKLASVQTIERLEPIEGSDRIELATVLGWKTIVKKGDFRPGDQAVYFEVDSLLPDGQPWAEFMRTRGFRVKTMKMRGALSQGLAMPLAHVFESHRFPDGSRRAAETSVGTDLTEFLGVQKYEVQGPESLNAAGNFPSYVPKTEEVRLQAKPTILWEMRGREFIVTTKLDGTSWTAVHPDELNAERYGHRGVFACSRNLMLKRDEVDDDGNKYNAMIERYRLDERLPKGYALQGELVGPGIQGNPLGLTEKDVYLFNVWDIVNQRYLDYGDARVFADDLGMKWVPIEHVVEAGEESDLVGAGCMVPYWKFEHTLEKYLELAKGKYPSGQTKEGIVIRPLRECRSVALRGERLSFKVINNDFLLEEK